MAIFHPVLARYAVLGTLAGAIFCFSGTREAAAQSSDARAETVSWSAPTITAAKGDKAKLTLNGTVLTGWHVYSLKQALEGPTPLVVTLDANEHRHGRRRSQRKPRHHLQGSRLRRGHAFLFQRLQPDGAGEAEGERRAG